jgi:hypothetical protein
VAQPNGPDYLTAICQFDIGTGGAFAAKDPPWIATAGPGYHAAIIVSRDGRSVYTAGGSFLGEYSVGEAGGVLSYKSPATVPTEDYGRQIAISPGIASVRLSGKTLVFTAAPGARDNVEVTHPSRSTLRVTDRAGGLYTGSPIRAGAGCTQGGPFRADCHGLITRIKVMARDLPDKVINSTGVPSSL